MASVSVVGQHPGPHRLDSEPPHFVFKLSGVKKKLTPPRRVMFRRRSGSVPAGEEPAPQPAVPGPAGDMTPAEGCGAAPRSPPYRDGAESGTDRDRQPGTRGTRTGDTASSTTTGDRNSNVLLDSNHNTSGRRGVSLKKSSINVKAPAHGRAESRDGDGGGHAPWSSSETAAGHGGAPTLDRLTQARSGVVRLARPEPSRREAWSIFPRGVDPRVRIESGEGHRFEAKAVTRDWCDACSRRISAQALKCQNCGYTCHLECQRQVQLDCNQKDRELEKTQSPTSGCSSTAPRHKSQQNEAKEEEEPGTKALSAEEVRIRIEDYNAQISKNGMKLAPDGSYTGFINVHLRLSRPVTVPAVKGAGSEGAGGHGRAPSEDPEGMEKRTSFYLPCDCVKQVHITSLVTTRELIQGLLKKFMVLDNPRKFALYRQTHRDGQDLLQKLPLCEQPLLLRLIAGPDPMQLSFVLKENETGEVEWHAFSVPELQNFLVILGKEEAERMRTVEQKYAAYRQKLQRALQQHDP